MAWMFQKWNKNNVAGLLVSLPLSTGWAISMPGAQVMEMYFYSNLLSLLGLFSNDSTAAYINPANNARAVSFLFDSLLGTQLLWNHQTIVSITALPFHCLFVLKNTGSSYKKLHKNKCWEAFLLITVCSNLHAIITHTMDEPLQLPQPEIMPRNTMTAADQSNFLPPSLLHSHTFPLHVFIQKPEFALWPINLELILIR